MSLYYFCFFLVKVGQVFLGYACWYSDAVKSLKLNHEQRTWKAPGAVISPPSCCIQINTAHSCGWRHLISASFCRFSFSPSFMLVSLSVRWQSGNGELPLTSLRRAGNLAFLVLPLHSVVLLLQSSKTHMFYRSFEFQDIEELVI